MKKIISLFCLLVSTGLFAQETIVIPVMRPPAPPIIKRMVLADEFPRWEDPDYVPTYVEGVPLPLVVVGYYPINTVRYIVRYEVLRNGEWVSETEEYFRMEDAVTHLESIRDLDIWRGDGSFYKATSENWDSPLPYGPDPEKSLYVLGWQSRNSEDDPWPDVVRLKTYEDKSICEYWINSLILNQKHRIVTVTNKMMTYYHAAIQEAPEYTYIPVKL